MKNNRKNRKLEFIRFKNKLRLGFCEIANYTKISLELIEDLKEKEYKDILFALKLELINNLKNKYKFSNYEIKEERYTVRQIYDDFIRQMYTIIYECKITIR